MKKRISWKLVCGVMAGFLMQFSAAQAENANDGVQRFLGGENTSISQQSDTPAGPQGPIRTDMTDDKSNASSGFEQQDFPYSSDDNKFPYPDGG